jgi:23S rRNA (adenine2503-C2)-methyltransferase
MLPTGEQIESVLMIYKDRATVCVSTQAGCAMGCTFCATGRLGLLRNLESHHIVEQVLWARRTLRQLSKTTSSTTPTKLTDDAWWGDDGGHPDALPQHLGNVVFMGMGEPFANYDRWWQAVERLHDPQGINIGARGLTVSTVGLVPGIKRLADAPFPINLAISLHAPNDTLRSAMMPVNKRWNVAELIDTTREYVRKTGRRVSFEYVLLQGENDTPELAGELADLLQGMLCHVNLIPWNPVPGMPLGRSERQRVVAFQRVLQAAGVPCTVRVERGVSIAAACGQLAGAPVSGP